MSAVTTIGPGRLVLIAGPNPKAKNELVQMALPQCPGAVVPPRAVSDPKAGLDFEVLSREAFETGIAAGDFAFHWYSHENYYGVLSVANDHIRNGKTVIVGTTRRVVNDIRKLYSNVVVVQVDVPVDGEPVSSLQKPEPGWVLITMKPKEEMAAELVRAIRD